MNIIDLHCDTLTEIEKHGTTLNNSCHHFSLSRLPEKVGWLQFFAIFMPDELRGQTAADYFDRVYARYLSELQNQRDYLAEAREHAAIGDIWRQGKCAAVLSVEGGSALCGDLDRVAYLAGCGVRMLTLTWNGQNEIGGGQAGDTGLTPFGRQVIPALEQHNIIVDVSHLGEKGFWEVAELAKRPIVASHSNSKAICGHDRNLTDEQFRWMVKQGGLVGLNFCPAFISVEGKDTSKGQLYRHLAHFLALGGEDTIAIGSDFDGTDVPVYLDSPEKLSGFANELGTMGLTQVQIDKLTYKNAYRFLARYGF